VFRRRPTDAQDVLETEQPDQDAVESADEQPARSSITPKKAGPTPKRSEAQANRRGPYQAPADRKAATQQSRQRDRTERSRRAQALQRGEDWALPAKDRGPVRALARDVVDSRRGLSEYYLFAVIPIFILIFLPSASLKLAADALVLVILVIVFGEGYLVGRKVQQLAKERYPGQSLRGVRLYAAMRGTQLRRLRVPKPRVGRGDAV
jgi:Protein of unknown function (DUF3043)